MPILSRHVATHSHEPSPAEAAAELYFSRLMFPVSFGSAVRHATAV